MMKSNLIKDLCGEIDRLKAEVYAAREKNGVYLPRERYYQEESERKAMADQIEQMGVTIENHQKQFEELRAKFDAEVLNSSELSIKLDDTEKKFVQTCELLANAKEEVQRCQSALSEQDFKISEPKEAGREDKLNADNRSGVDNYQAELTLELRTLCNTVAASISQQNEHLQCIKKFCKSFSDVNVKVCSNAGLEEISTVVAANVQVEKFLGAESVEANLIFDELHKSLSIKPGELAFFASELRQKFAASIDLSTNISKSFNEFLDNLIVKEAKQLEIHASDIGEVQTKSITDFQKAYEMEPSLSSLAFSGSVREGVSKVKQEKKLLVVYVSGDNPESRNLEKCTWMDSRLAEVLSKYCILLHIPERSVDAALLSKKYPQKSSPCTTLIGDKGVLIGVQLWQSEGFFTAEILASVIEKACQLQAKRDVLLGIRLVDQTLLQEKFSLTSILREVKNYVDEKQEISMGSYDLAIPYPRRVFGNEDLNKSLSELYIVDRQSLIVVPHRSGSSASSASDGNRKRPTLSLSRRFGSNIHTLKDFQN